MGKILIAIICLFASTAFANQKAFDIKMDLTIDGKHVSSPRIVVKEGEKGSITQESNNEKSFIEVVATEQKSPDGRDAIMMSFAVGKIALDGSKTIESRPQILSAPNKKALINIGKKGDKTTLSLTVIANKTTL